MLHLNLAAFGFNHFTFPVLGDLVVVGWCAFRIAFHSYSMDLARSTTKD